MNRSIGGPLGAQQLGQLLGHRQDQAPPPPHALALRDAIDALRRAGAALRACDLPRAGDAAEIGIVHSVLVDQLVALQQVERRL